MEGNWAFGLDKDPRKVNIFSGIEIQNIENDNIASFSIFWKLVNILTFLLKDKQKYFPFLQRVITKKFSKIIDKNAHIIFPPYFFTLCRLIYNDEFFNWMKNNVRGKLILYNLDPLSTFKRQVSSDFWCKLNERFHDNSFDLCLTYTLDDFQYYRNFKYLPFPYNELSDKKAAQIMNSSYFEPHKYELTSVGSIGFRKEGPKAVKFDKVSSVLKFFNEYNLRSVDKLNFSVIFTGDIDSYILENCSLPDLSESDAPGGNMCNRLFNTNCVMHIAEQNYISFGHLEAVRFDRKLFTDSDCVKLEKWYDPEYVRVFDPFNLTDDDISWIKKPVNVDYQNKQSITMDSFLSKLYDYIDG
jgi:hypothetical protein